MLERGLPSPTEAVDIAKAYLAEFSDPQKRSQIAINIIIGVYDTWAEMGKSVVEPREFIDFIDKFQSELLPDEEKVEDQHNLLPARDDILEIDITRSLRILEFTEAARGELSRWQEGAIKHPELYPLANEWVSRVLMLEAATRIKTQTDAQKARLDTSALR